MLASTQHPPPFFLHVPLRPTQPLSSGFRSHRYLPKPPHMMKESVLHLIHRWRCARFTLYNFCFLPRPVFSHMWALATVEIIVRSAFV